MDKSNLRKLVLEAIRINPKDQFENICSNVQEQLLKIKGTENNSSNHDRNRYNQNLSNHYRLLVDEIFWDLINERIITLGLDTNNLKYPWYRVTAFGEMVLEDEKISLFHHDDYVFMIKKNVPMVDEGLIQYIQEGHKCFNQRLFFASAVMFGAASERLLLILIKSLESAEQDEKRKKECKNLFEREGYSKLFDYLDKRIKHLIENKILPYSIHEGLLIHMSSVLEMIRSHRNGAVHPRESEVSRDKIFLTVQSLPVVIERLYILKKWLDENQISSV